MANEIDVKIPDIGDATDVDVIEVLVNVGDSVTEGDSLVTLESDKASMDIPSDASGVVKQLNVKVGDKVSMGHTILILDSDSAKPTKTSEVQEPSPQEAEVNVPKAPASAPASEPVASEAMAIDKVYIPDIGDAKDVDVIEVMVSAGDMVAKEQALITLEGDKATMDIPAPFAGEVKSVEVKVGDKVSQGDAILTMALSAAPTEALTMDSAPEPAAPPRAASQGETRSVPESQSSEASKVKSVKGIYASPSIRRIAREFGVDLSEVNGSGRKGRITKEDVQKFVKARLASGANQVTLAKIPVVDFSKFGEIEAKPLNKIKRLTATNMYRSWVNIPHVTQFDEADITELETFRQSQKERALKMGIRLTPLAFIVKAVVKALIAFPEFNASLDESGDNLILKKYYNIGIAVDTPNGLVVPVIKDAERLGLNDIAKAMGELSEKARNKQLKPQEMSGGSFTISSLGGISGTAFTPIINAPEVAIVGVSRSQWKPVFIDGDFTPRLILPLSLSYDHRVIDGAEAARFTQYLTQSLSDIRTLLL